MAGLRQNKGGNGNGSVKIIDVTYLELIILIGSSGLIPGCYYQITDFRTRQIVPETGGAVITTGAVEPILLFAVTTSELDKEAKSTLFETDVIYYNPIDTSFGADRGRIYHRNDTVSELVAAHDWRVVLFRRWEDAAGNNVIATPNANPFADFFTFANLSTGEGCNACEVFNNLSGQSNNVIGEDNQIISIGENATQNTTLTDVLKSKIGEESIDNALFTDCMAIATGSNSDSNTFGLACTAIEIGNFCSSNTFPDNSAGITFQDACSSNNTGTNGNLIHFGISCSNNTFGDDCGIITFSISCSMNTFGESVQNSTFGPNCFSNTFGDNNNFIQFIGNASGNIFQNGITDVTFGWSALDNTIADEALSIRFGNVSSDNAIGEGASDIDFDENSSSNTIGAATVDINYGNACTANVVGDNCISIRLAGNNALMSIADQCEDIYFGSGVSSRTLPFATVHLEEYLTYGNAGFVYDAAIHGGAIGDNPFGSLPAGARIMNGYNNNSTLFASPGAANIGFGIEVDDPLFIESIMNFNDADYDVNDPGRYGTWSQITASDPDGGTTAANRKIVATIDTDIITEGRRVHQFYFIVNTV